MSEPMNGEIFYILIWSTIATCGLLIPIQAYTLCKALAGTKYTRVVLLVTLLLISNICSMFWGIALFMAAQEQV